MKVPYCYLAAVLLAVSCASAPSVQVDAPRTVVLSAPDWTSRSIFMEGPNIVFVLSGPENSVVADLARGVMASYLDLPVGPTTPVVAAQAIQKFLDSMAATSPSDRYAKNGQGYWKVAVSKENWDLARAQLKALIDQSSADPSLALERAADDLLRQGRYFDAVSGYVAAASTALTEAKSPARYRANLLKAQDIVSRLTLTSATPALVTRVGQPFETSFDVKLSYGAGTQAPPVPGALLRFSYKVKKNGRIAVAGQTVKTDALGHVLFELPVPEFAVRDSLVVVVDVNPWLEALASVPKEQRDPVAAFETLAGDRRLLLPYTVESAAKQVPMIVALADFDEKGSVQRRQESSAALITALQKAGFQASSIPVNPTLLKSTNDSVVLAAWKFQGKTSGRAVYGTVSLVGVTPSGSQFAAEVSGTVKVADLGTGKGLFQLTTTKVVIAADKATATTQAYRQWASDAVESLESDLP